MLSIEYARVCSRFSASRVAGPNHARLGAGRWKWLFPFQVVQRRLARFGTQPEGPGLFLREAALLEDSLGTTKLRLSRLASHKNRLRRGRDETGTDPKQMAKTLRGSLAKSGQEISHSYALELVAQQLGHKDWNTASAILPHQSGPSAVTFDAPIPILRSFDETKAREFYLDFLGFSVEFEHRFETDLPLYLGISRNGLQLHLSEHHGDASPGATVFIPMHNIELLRDELLAKRYGYGRPDIVEQGWGKVLEVYDPFGNRLRFCQD